jgi:hypothetical protein
VGVSGPRQVFEHLEFGGRSFCGAKILGLVELDKTEIGVILLGQGSHQAAPPNWAFSQAITSLMRYLACRPIDA